jgi:hypothetical protein
MEGVINMAKRVLKNEEVSDKDELQVVRDGKEENMNATLGVEKECIEVIENTESESDNTNPEIQQTDIVVTVAGSEEEKLYDFQHDIQPVDKVVEKELKEEGTVFRSTSEELRCIIRNVVEDGEVYSKKVLVRILNEKASTGYTDACLINVLRNMVTDGSLMQVERGSYMKGNGSFKSRLHKYLSATRSGLKKACTLNASEMEEADFEIIKQIKAVECDLDILMETLEKLGA